MKLRSIRSICAVALLLLGASTTAMADVTITMHATFSSPMLDNSPQIQSTLAPYSNSTEYISGNHVRIDTGGMSVLVDTSMHKVYEVNNTSKTYSTMDLSPALLSQMLSGDPVPSLGIPAGATFNMIDTGKSTQLLGHTVRHYKFTGSVPLGQMGTMTVTSDILAAQDFSAADMAAFDALNAMNPGETHMQGIPLATTTTITGGPIGNMTIKQAAREISVKPIDPAIFQVPSDYTQTQIPPMASGVQSGPPAQ